MVHTEATVPSLSIHLMYNISQKQELWTLSKLAASNGLHVYTEMFRSLLVQTSDG